MVRLGEMRNMAEHAGTLNNLGVVYVDMGDYTTAIKYLEESLFVSKKQGDKISEASTLSNLGYFYEKVGDLVRAVEFYEKALLISKEFGS